MIDKLQFYHGAAILCVVEDPRCNSISKNEFGYLINAERLVALKYTTKAHSPWRFTVTSDDIARLDKAALQFGGCALALICGGDGICALFWASARALLGGKPGWLSAKRVFAGCYALSGPEGTMRKKITLNRWPELIFEDGEEVRE